MSTNQATSTTLRETNKQIAREFLRLLEVMDIEAWAELWAEEGIQEMPFPPDGLPPTITRSTGLKYSVSLHSSNSSKEIDLCATNS